MLGQNLVLGMDLLLQVGDPLLVGRMVRSRFLLEGGRAVLEELLLPAVENGGLQAEFIAELRDRLILQQMPPQDGDLFFRRVVLVASSCVVSFTSLGERLLHFHLNRDKARNRVPLFCGAIFRRPPPPKASHQGKKAVPNQRASSP